MKDKTNSNIDTVLAAGAAPSKVKLEIPRSKDENEQQVPSAEEDERQFSPPVSKEEIISDDLISVHESAGQWLRCCL